MPRAGPPWAERRFHWAIRTIALTSFGLGALTEVALIRPVGRKSQFAVFIVTIGLFTGLNWLAAAIWGTEALPKTIASKRPPFPKLIEVGDKCVRICGATWR